MSFVNFDDYEDDEIIQKPEPLKIKPSNDNLYEYHDSTSYNKYIYENFIDNLTITDSITILNNNIDDHEVTYDIVTKLMKNLKLIQNSDISLMKFHVLIQLLLREDYSKPEYNLEQELGNIAVYWIAENKDTITENEYKSIWNNLRQGLLGPKLTGMFYKFCKYPDLDKNFAELYTSFVIIDPNYDNKQRYVTYQEKKKLENILNIDEEKTLVIEDLIDAKKNDNKWYVAKIVDINEVGILVEYSGWNNEENALIPFGTNSIAKLGKITNGIQHNNTILCGCNKCVNNSIICPCNDPNCVINSMVGTLSGLTDSLNLQQLLFQYIKDQSTQSQTTEQTFVNSSKNKKDDVKNYIEDFD